MPTTSRSYNDPANGQPSTVGIQQRTDYYKRKALVDVQEEMYFGQFADKEMMPKHYGKKIVQNVYLPILHDGNFTDQGIDASGLTTVRKVTITIIAGGAVKATFADNRENGLGTHYAVGEGADAAAAIAAAQADAEDIFRNLGVFDTDYATTVAALTGLATDPWTVVQNADVPATGNLWGSSRDVGNVTAKLPGLGEHGGRVNRVGMHRVSIESELTELGIFEEYTANSYAFDSDAELEMHAHRELLRAAGEISEDALQLDLLNAAGLVRFGGDATRTSEITGEVGATASIATYDDFMRLDIDLTNNKAPKKIKAILGSSKFDTRTVESARVLIVGSEMVPTLKAMQDNFGNQAFKYVHEYADAQKPMNGEIGAIDAFRIIVSPRMMYWEGAGAPVTNNGGYRETGGNYDVYPMLAISMGAFTEISFHSGMGGKAGSKWKVMHQKPGIGSMEASDPFGRIGRRSISWFYGSLITRPDWIGLFKVVAKV